MTPESGTRGRFPFAGALRAAATLCVVAYHCWTATINTGRGTGPQWLAMLGAFGVACFFALSGFLLSRPFIESLDGRRAWPSWRDFARDRFLRIYPLYAFLVVAMTLGARWLPVPGEHPAGWIDALAHLSFIFPFFRYTALSVDPPMWTMSTDVQFYVVLPLLMAVIARLAPRRVTLGVAALVLLSIAYRLANAQHAQAAFDDFGVRVGVFEMLPGMFAAFGGGIIAMVAWQRIAPASRRQWGWMAFAVMLPFAWAALAPWPAGITNFILWNDVMAGLAAPLLLFAGCALLQSPLVENPVVRWAERLSYGVYLTHFFVIEYAEAVTGPLHGMPFFVATTALSYGLSLAVALPLHLVVERPFLELKSRLRVRAA